MLFLAKNGGFKTFNNKKQMRSLIYKKGKVIAEVRGGHKSLGEAFVG